MLLHNLAVHTEAGKTVELEGWKALGHRSVLFTKLALAVEPLTLQSSSDLCVIKWIILLLKKKKTQLQLTIIKDASEMDPKARTAELVSCRF